MDEIMDLDLALMGSCCSGIIPQRVGELRNAETPLRLHIGKKPEKH
jgi:hypothetical protein